VRKFETPIDRVLRLRPVHEVEVDVVHPQPVQAGVDAGERRFITLVAVPKLGRDEDLGAVDSGCGERTADAFLVSVDHGGVDVPVAKFEGGGDGLLNVFSILDLERAEAEKRDVDVAVKGDGGVR
jgi:hypothetical protein